MRRCRFAFGKCTRANGGRFTDALLADSLRFYRVASLARSNAYCQKTRTMVYDRIASSTSFGTAMISWWSRWMGAWSTMLGSLCSSGFQESGKTSR